MAFDNETRGKLQRFVTDIRALLTEDFTRQLQQTYGMDPASGEIASIESLKHLDDERLETAQILRDIMDHYLASEAKNEKQTRTSVLQRIAREQAFTILNRLAALRMMEARGILLESIGQGTQSQAFRLYQQVANGSLGDTGETYKHFLYSLFDIFAADLPSLFDRYGPQSRLFPREVTLTKALDLVNGSEIKPLWSEDETIGWIYQYFNSKEERKAMRDASQAPRNSRELAVRNQFFTPRYVVEFLVDNTLGRLWFNWTGGQTDLRDRCQYLLVKPDEQPEPAKRLRDPRTIKLLDPACGSMHFGLYTFDLFLEIYREAWAWEQTHGPGCLDSETGGSADLKPLSQTYADQDAFLHDVPRLIIEHNIYGVDIDPRAAQIASLALWLRAQRAWHEAGVKAKDRPHVGRGHVVAAVAPPAEVDLRKRFMEELDPLDAELFEKTLFLLKGLPELGVLLQVEKELPALVRAVFGEHGDLFREEDMAQWQKAEARLQEALTEFARAARSTYQGRLFAEDALQGMRVIDHCREKFDVVVMNPPFGEVSQQSKQYVFGAYPVAKFDLAATFWNRAADLVRPDGLIGCLASRAIFFGQMLEGWRRHQFVEQGALDSCLDLGVGVLDAAMVEAVAGVSANIKTARKTHFFKASENPENILDEIHRFRGLQRSEAVFEVDVRTFLPLPGFPFSYWIPEPWLLAFHNLPPLEEQGVSVKQGMETSDNFRFVRLWWEPAANSGHWRPYSKGGSFGPQWRDIDVSVNWKDEGHEVKTFSASKYGTWTKQITNSAYYGKPGIVYPASRVEFSPRVVPAGNVIGCKGPIITFENEPFQEESYLRLLAILSSSSFRALLNLTITSGETRRHSYREKAVAQTPAPGISEVSDKSLRLISSVIVMLRELDSGSEIKRGFVRPLGASRRDELIASIRENRDLLDQELSKNFGFIGRQYLGWVETGYDDLVAFSGEHSHEIVSFCVGCAFGRWSHKSPKQQESSVSRFSPFDKLLVPTQICEETGISDGEPKRGFPVIIEQSKGNPNCISELVLQYLDSLGAECSIENEQELCHKIKASSVFDYFDREGGFFDAHLKHYTSSRRKAPIYWPISSESGGYKLWLYYPALNNQTLFTAVNDFIEPKLKQVGQDVTILHNQGSARTAADEKSLEQLQSLVTELSNLRDILLEIAPTYRPNLEDGVQISAAPLWRLFRHKPWQNALKTTWEKLEKGDYDWAHLAMAYWPDRVREKCKIDKSLAIAHDLEALYEEPKTGGAS